MKVSKRAAFIYLLYRLPEERFFSSASGERDLLFEVMAGEFLLFIANFPFSGIGSFKDWASFDFPLLMFRRLSYEPDFTCSDCLSVSKETFDSCFIVEVLTALFAREVGLGSLEATLRSLLPAARVVTFYVADDS